MYWLPSIATGLKRLESMQTWNLLYTRIEARGAGRGNPYTKCAVVLISSLKRDGVIRDFGISYKEFRTQYQ